MVANKPAPLSEAVKLAIARLTSALEQAERERKDYSDMAKQSTSEKLIAQADNAALRQALDVIVKGCYELQAIAEQALASAAEGAMSKEEAAKIIDAGFGSRPDLPTGTEFVDEIRHGRAQSFMRRNAAEKEKQ